MPTQLPQKENTVFKRILKSYEQKQYKNGLKFCKQILSNPKFAEHGETLAMKGLTLNCLGRKDEAYDYVRRGLRNDLKSHVCWHVFGLLQRSDRKYDEAIKCYRNALKWDKNNLQILRDLSMLQIQMRDLEGFKETRYCLLNQRPSQRLSWIGYSISHYLLGEYEVAYQIIEEFRKIQLNEGNIKPFDYEDSEMLLYQNMILQESGREKESLEHLEMFQSNITDKRQMKEIQAKLQFKLGNALGAKTLYHALIKRNPENWTYYKQLIACIKPDSEQGHLKILAEYRQLFPKAEAPRRLALDYSSGDVFKGLVNEYMRIALRKGVPPLFINLQPLYHNKEKAHIIETLVAEFIKNLEEQKSFDSTEDKSLEDPTVLLWTYFYASQHYDHFRKTKLALEFINKVLDHTPTLVEGYMVKAKIFKHAGCMSEAAKWIDEGRMLDTADRYVNSKCAKYFLRDNNVKKAEELCSLFERVNDKSEETSTQDSLHEMQCMWFEVECGNAYKKLGQIGEALKQCHRIDKHFVEINEDQFDFHTYCMRKVTLSAYIRLLKLEDVLRNHSFYFKAAKLAIESYLELHDKPYNDNNDNDINNKGGLSAKEVKKLKSKQRRAEKKAQTQDEVKSGENKENKESEKGNDKKKEQFVPSVLVKTESPLEEAIKFLKPLQQLVRDNIITHFLTFEIYFRKGKPLLMLQAINRAIAIDSSHPTLHECIVRFLQYVSSNSDKFDPIVCTVVEKGIVTITNGKSAEAFNDAFKLKHPKDLSHRLSALKMCYYLDNSKANSTIDVLTDLSQVTDNVTLENCTTILKLLNEEYFGSSSHSSSAAESFKLKCHEIFPYSDAFRDGEIVSEINGDSSELSSENAGKL